MCSPRAVPAACRSILVKFLRRTNTFTTEYSGHLQPLSNHDRATTAYLDGMRGLAVAAVIIYNLGHAIDQYWAWGSGFGIPLFCVISGFVFSLKPLRQIRQQKWDETLSTITSHIFRRILRIYIPAMVATFLAFVMLRLNLYDFSSNFQKPSIRKLPSWSAQFSHLIKEDFSFFYLLRWSPTSPTYLSALWTLQTMMRGPLVLSLTIMGLSRSQEVIRSTVVGLLMLASYRNNQPEIMSLMGGLVLAERYIARQESKEGPLGKFEQPMRWQASTRFLSKAGLVVSTILLAMPNKCDVNSLSLCSLFPKERTELVHHLAAMLLVWSTGHSVMAQKVFMNNTLQKLGCLSYSAYLVHGPIIESVGYRIFNLMLGSPVRASFESIPGILLGSLITGSVIFCAANFFMKYVDLPVISLARRAESKFSVPPLAMPVSTIGSARVKVDEIREDLVAATAKSSTDVKSAQIQLAQKPKLEQTCSTTARFLWFLVPSFIQDYLRPPSTEKKIHPTAWLDGLRGYAALFVFWYHLMNPFHPRHLDGYGYNPAGSYLIQLPIFRLIYNGNVMVYIFFVISGYVLSMKGISQIRSGSSYTALFSTVSSSIFRRAIRLAIPPLVSTFINMVLLQLGVFGLTQSIATDASILPGYREPHLMKLDSLFAQFCDWVQNSENMTRLFTGGTSHNRYDPHTWTINVEFRCSMLVFLYLTCFARTKTWLRVSFCCILSLCLWQLDAWHENMFLLGIIVAEINQIQKAISATSEAKKLDHRGWSSLRDVFWWFMFFLSLYVASCPEREPWKVRGYRTLVRIIGMRHFWARIGCPMLVFSIANSPSIQSIFSNRLARILANLSFSCYLIHYLTIHTVGYAVVPMLWKIFGRDTTWGYEASFVLGAVVVTWVTVWLSDIFWRVVDAPSVKFARWLENKCLIQSEKLRK